MTDFTQDKPQATTAVTSAAQPILVAKGSQANDCLTLDVIIPTYNRATLLKRTFESLLAALLPLGLTVQINVVDNNSSDDTAQVVEGYQDRFTQAGLKLRYLFESQQGRSHALNRGITETNGALIGLIDDDEEVDAQWFECIGRVFKRSEIDFIGGPCKPRWSQAAPVWLPQGYGAVLGLVEAGDAVQGFGQDYNGMLMGGNAVLRRAVLQRVGLYAPHLGRGRRDLLAGEDQDMSDRLLAAGARGEYRPDLIIYHFVPPERLTKHYYRRRIFWNGVSHGLIDRERPQAVPYLLGVPRFLFAQALAGVQAMALSLARGQKVSDQRFSGELTLWYLLGFLYGKHRHHAA
jgi:glucosyl-dolichyl phosphate glucuronosyltransferase